MEFITDFHIHSHYSIATSKDLIPEYLHHWARLKGIDVIGTGDCIHPGWLKELKEKLEPAGNGLYKLKKEFILPDTDALNNTNKPVDVFFLLTGEISNIYKKNDKVRKVHNLCIFPDFNAVETTQKKLADIGNIESDGRPILGLDSKYLLEIVLESSDYSYLIPAHIWTPWFSVLGSKSGFENIEECYEDLTQHIFAVETGLSSDPAMNYTCTFLDKFKLVSNSDAHSPQKLGREANLFNTELTYQAIFNALKEDHGFLGTIEFFPQEGKYHYDGHRNCDICWDPLETLKHNGLCPVCSKQVTKGVMYRISELANRSKIDEAPNKKYFQSITSLPDLISETLKIKSSATKAVQQKYFNLIENIGSEFYILLYAENCDIRKHGGELIAEGIERLRNGQVFIEEGFDGRFGRIRVFDNDELNSFSGVSLFLPSSPNKNPPEQSNNLSVRFNIEEFQDLRTKSQSDGSEILKIKPELLLTEKQRDGIEHFKGPCMIIAGPGSGKTRILTERIIHLVTHRNIKAENILAITFSNKASKEIQERTRSKINTLNANISTFHAFGFSILKEYYNRYSRDKDFFIIDYEEKKNIIAHIFNKDKRRINEIINKVEAFKQGRLYEGNENILDIIINYDKKLQTLNAFDLEDLLYLPVELFKQDANILNIYREKYKWILIDEYQDINEKQYELIHLLAGNTDPNLFVIGDPDQSIYSFRGSDLRFIEQFKKDFPTYKYIQLDKSYRCPSPVLKIASQMLQKDNIMSGKQSDIKVYIQETETEKSEADWIASQIEKMIGGVRSFSIDSGISDGTAYSDSVGFSDFAVLCRMTGMFDPIIQAFENHGIAYQVVGTEPFYRREPFSSAIKHFRHIYYNIIYDNTVPETESLKAREMIDNNEDIYKILMLLLKENEITDDDLNRIKQLTGSWGNDYNKFLINLSTQQGIDDFDNKIEAVPLMTLHASKGLEFNTVFIPGCEEGIIPFELFKKRTNNEIEEEERLFYVGITRTMNNLFLSYAKKRYYKEKLLDQQRSSFVNRLEEELLHFEKREPKKDRRIDEIQLTLFSQSDQE
ncbi:MAG: UvrD-helicase domain-containing protein [Spirochaetota bacterium]|nr:UvrD-helicase domain-containing protein [Spirochaetota bacterium]